MKVNNIPAGAVSRKYVVARYVDGEFWYWGSWDSIDKATEVALTSPDLVVVPMEETGVVR